MAVEVEDHPLDYGDFEGEIPAGQYGAGTVVVWDRGEWIPIGDPVSGLRTGKLEFELRGSKLAGKWNLVRLRKRSEERKPTWLLIKSRDARARRAEEYDVVAAESEDGKSRGMKARHARKRAPSGRGAAVDHALPRRVHITHPERVIDPTSEVRKVDLMRYYIEAAPHLLPQLRGRPVALVRAPAGVDGPRFFQKHADASRIPGIKQLDRSLDPGHPPLIEIASMEALLGAVQMNVIEFHTWNARVRSIEKPDRIVFDLDPGEGVTWPQVRDGAKRVRNLLAEMKLTAFLKTSGGNGLHLVVPLQPRFDWETVRAFAQAIVRRLVRDAPDRFVAKSGPKNRVGRVFIDYLRNGRGATTVAAWSARARHGLGISVPIGWDELGSVRAGDQWTVGSVRARLDRADAWAGYANAKQSLRPGLEALVERT